MAAGKGSRLGGMTSDKPKAFVEIEGISLIEINIALLHAYGIKDILIATGYMNERFEELADKISGVRCVYNPFYEMMNVAGSFFMLQEYIDDSFIYMHADTLCAPEIFERMLADDADMALPVEFKRCDEEAMKVKTSGSMLTEISKQIPCDEGEGEFIGMMKISKGVLADLKTASKELMKEKRFESYFESIVQKIIDLRKYEVKCIPTGDCFWGEIDFIEDYERVCRTMPHKLIELAEKDLGNYDGQVRG